MRCPEYAREIGIQCTSFQMAFLEVHGVFPKVKVHRTQSKKTDANQVWWWGYVLDLVKREVTEPKLNKSNP